MIIFISSFTMETVENVLSDSRVNRCKKHKLESIILIVICATLKKVYGYQKIAEFAMNHAKELGDYIDLSNGCPSTVTLWRNFERLNIREVLEYIELKKDLLQLMSSLQSDYAPEDSTSHHRKIRGQSNLEILRSHISHNYISICDRDEDYQNHACKQRTMNDILEKLATKNVTIAAASRYNNHHTAHLIKKNHADYLLEITESNTYFFEQIKDQLDRHIRSVGKPEDWHIFNEGQDQKKRRFYCLENQLRWIEGIEKWPQVKCMVAIEEKRWNGEEYVQDTHYYLSSVKEWTAEKIFRLTEYHFHKPCAWIISFEMDGALKVQTATQKILKSNLMWIQNENLEIAQVSLS